MDKTGGLFIQNQDRPIFKLRRTICLTRIIQRKVQVVFSLNVTGSFADDIIRVVCVRHRLYG